jgi:hypothetical protein
MHYGRQSSPGSLNRSYASADQLMGAVFSVAVSPAICMNAGCDFTCQMEPDQDAGYCEECHTNTMTAAPVLAGLI